MVTFPHAKINLGLQVIEKRHDGYHNIISCFYPIGWCDVLEAIPAREFTFTTTGLDIPGSAQDNLCVRAYELLKHHHQIPPVQAHLHKAIPIGAGLGGGSSDASFMLRLLCELFDLNLPLAQLQEYAAQLGSDCPFFLEDSAKLVQGKGDELSSIDVSLPEGYLLVVCPDLKVSTAEAYSQLVPQTPQCPLADLLQSHSPVDWQQLSNDFEPSVFAQFPKIAELKDTLYQLGASYASMSGSGASVFGFFAQKPDLSQIPSQYSKWLQEI